MGRLGAEPAEEGPALAPDASGPPAGVWSLQPRHIIGARHILTHYDVCRDGRPYGRLPAGEDLRALLRALMAVLPPAEREALLHDMAEGSAPPG